MPQASLLCPTTEAHTHDDARLYERATVGRGLETSRSCTGLAFVPAGLLEQRRNCALIEAAAHFAANGEFADPRKLATSSAPRFERDPYRG